MTITAIIPHYFNQRASSLIRACDALMRGTVKPDEVLVWNNDLPLGFTMPGVDVIQSHRNVGPQARFLAALGLARGQYVFFQDNDVAVERRTLEHLRHEIDDDPDHILASLEGRRLTDGRYRSSIWLRPGVRRERADISLGRGEMIRRERLEDVLAHFPWASTPMMDDLVFSRCLARTETPIWVVPAASEVGLVQLPEYQVGARFEERHYQTRDLLCRQYWPTKQVEGTPCG